MPSHHEFLVLTATTTWILDYRARTVLLGEV
jgi:hypothetical protein